MADQSFSYVFEELPRKSGRDQAARHRAVMEERRSIAAQGHTPATVFNLHDFPLEVNFAEAGTLRCAAADKGAPARTLVDRVLLSMADHGDGDYRPRPIFPAQQVADLVKKYRAQGGVVCLPGDVAEAPAAALAAAASTRLEWLRTLAARAADTWTRHRQYRFISDVERRAARELHQRGEISQVPEWATAGLGSDQRPCPACAEMIKAAATKCRYCGERFAAPEKEEAHDAVHPAHRNQRK